MTESFLQGLASQVPSLSLTTWTAARGNPSLAKMLASDTQAAERVSFTDTPSFLVGRNGGKPAQAGIYIAD